MYKKILVALENGAADEHLLPHICQFARQVHAELLLLHVADGWAARNLEHLKLRESEEMREDRQYLEMLQRDLTTAGLRVEARLAAGDPATELIRAAEREHVDLIAMSTHGHRFLADLLHGATADRVRHLVSVPVLLLRAEKPAAPRERG